MHVYVLLQNEDRPTVCTRVLTHQSLQGLQVDKTHVVHSPVDLAYVNPEYCELVPVQGVLQEPQIHFHFEFCLQHYAKQCEVFPTLARVIMRSLFGRGYQLVD